MSKSSSKTAFFAAVLLSTNVYSPIASAQFGSLFSSTMSNLGSASANAGDPDVFLAQAKIAESLMSNSLESLVKSLISKEQRASHEAQLASANAITDPAEKKAKLEAVQKESAALINEKINNDNLKDKINSLNAVQKSNLGAAAFNFSLALLQDAALVAQATGIVASIKSNPMLIMKLTNLKAVGASLSNQLAIGSQLATKMPVIFSAVGVTAPTSKDDKPKIVAEGVAD